MKLSDIFDQLAYGELSQQNIVANEEVTPESMNRVIAHINMGLTELHKRFMLKRKTLTLKTLDDVTRYPLVAKHSETGGSTLPYILDANDPFQEDIIEILLVKDSAGQELILNTTKAHAAHMQYQPGDLAYQKHVFTPAYNILRFEDGIPVDTYTVEYKANHPVIPKITDLLTFDASKVEVELPMSHLEALLFYIASRVITPMSGAINGAPQEGLSYAQRFEQACGELMLQGLDVEEHRESTRFSSKGFV